MPLSTSSEPDSGFFINARSTLCITRAVLLIVLGIFSLLLNTCGTGYYYYSQPYEENSGGSEYYYYFQAPQNGGQSGGNYSSGNSQSVSLETGNGTYEVEFV